MGVKDGSKFTINKGTLQAAMTADRASVLTIGEHIETARGALEALNDQEMSGDRAKAIKDTMTDIKGIIDKVEQAATVIDRSSQQRWEQFCQDIDIKTVDASLMAAAQAAKDNKARKLKGR